MREPWFRKQTGYWYVADSSGAQHKLSTDKGEAFEKWHAMQSQAGAQRFGGQFAIEVIAEYLGVGVAALADTTREQYTKYLVDFSTHVGRLALADLKPLDVT